MALSGNLTTFQGTSNTENFYIDNDRQLIDDPSNQDNDTAYSWVDYALDDNVENLSLLSPYDSNGYLIPQKIDGRIVYGHPIKWNLDYVQGSNEPNYAKDGHQYPLYFGGDCGIVSVENILIMAGKLPQSSQTDNSWIKDLQENALVQDAINNDLCVTSPEDDPLKLGGTSAQNLVDLLNIEGVASYWSPVWLPTVEEKVKKGYGVILALSSDILWGESTSGVQNHAVTVTGVVYDTGNNLIGFYICDSGDLNEARYVSKDILTSAINVWGAYQVITDEPIKNWSNDINGTGNELDNIITGNDGNNNIYGLSGNDTIYGGDGGDTVHGGSGNDIIYGFLNKAGATESEYADDKGNFLYGGDGNDIIWSGKLGDDYLDGGTGNDVLQATGSNGSTMFGNSGDDKLYGSSGNDILNGGSGYNTLEGGIGSDTYKYDPSQNGQDVIIDSDGQGQILYNGNTLQGGQFTSSISAGTINGKEVTLSTFTDTITGNVYRWWGDGNDLVINNGKITVKNFHNGNLGINLPYSGNSDDTNNHSNYNPADFPLLMPFDGKSYTIDELASMYNNNPLGLAPDEHNGISYSYDEHSFTVLDHATFNLEFPVNSPLRIPLEERSDGGYMNIIYNEQDVYVPSDKYYYYHPSDIELTWTRAYSLVYGVELFDVVNGDRHYLYSSEVIAKFYNNDNVPPFDSTDINYGPTNNNGSGSIDDQRKENWNGANGDPLLLDLNGDGINTVPLENKTYFDINNTGFAQNTSWVNSDDGVLALDRNNNEIIDNGTELFIFDTLAELDTNLDGKIDSNDNQFANLKVFKGDGALYSLSDLEIQSLNLTYTADNTMDLNGNTRIAIGSYTNIDSTTLEMSEYNLKMDPYYSMPTQKLSLSPDIAALPDATGTGNTYSLSQAMVRDTSGELKTLVQQFVNDNNSITNYDLVDQILYKWTNSVNLDPNSRGSFDARQLGVIESFMGEYFQGSSTSIPDADAIIYLNKLYSSIKEKVYAELMSQSHLSYLYQESFVYNQNTNLWDFNLNGTIALIKNWISRGEEVGKQTLKEFNRLLEGLGLNNYMEWTDFYNSFAAMGDEYKQILDNSTASIVYGSSDNNTLYGSDDTDFIYGKSGDDTLIGNKGNDYLYENEGNDTYIFNKGDGQDIISDSSGIDKIQFGSDITKENTTFRILDNDIIISFKDSEDTITLKNQTNSDFRIENFQFYDGAILSFDDILSRLEINGTQNDDNLDGSIFSEKIFGNAGNDIISAGDSDDTIAGNIGNDIIYGGQGNDLYIFNKGDGQDIIDEEFSYGQIENNTIQFGEGILLENTNFKLRNNTFTIDFVNSEDKITINNYLNPEMNWYPPEMYEYLSAQKINAFNFSDGTTLSFNDLNIYNEINTDEPFIQGTYISDKIYGNDQTFFIDAGSGNDTVYGGAGNEYINGGSGSDILDGGSGDDYISGQEGNDTLIGGIGNDYLQGDTENDTYIFNLGDGLDTIFDWDGIDTLKFGADISVQNLILTQDYNNLVIGIKDIEDQITIQEYFSDDIFKIENFAFANGNSYNLQELQNAIANPQEPTIEITGTDNNDNLVGNELNNIIDGFAGADTMSGLTGNDTYYVDNIGDFILENSNEGIDTVQSNISYTLSNNVENLTLTGLNSINGTGNELDNQITGNNENNVLEGKAGNDTYLAKAGNDTITDLAGNDTYIYNSGDGQDIIIDLAGTDSIKFGENIAQDDLIFIKDKNDLIMALKDTSERIIDASDKITVKDWYLGNKIEFLEFSNNTTLSTNDIEKVAKALVIGTNANNKIKEKTTNSVIDAGAGNDKIYDFYGNDIISGGTGNDKIVDKAGSDIYIFNSGDGKDTLYDLSNNTEDKVRFGTGVLKGDIALFMKGNTLTLSYGNDDSITIYNQGNQNHGIERFELNDGSYLSDTDINNIIQNMTAYEKAHKGVHISDVNDVRNNQELMTLINPSR